MTTALERPQNIVSAAEALQIAQQAPILLRKLAPWSVPWPLSLLLNSDSVEHWNVYENLFYSCLRTGDIRSAHMCLTRMKTRFGAENEHVMGMMGLYHEAVAPDNAILESYLEEYDETLELKPTNMIIRKRRIALLKSLGKTNEAMAELVEYIEISPIDAEAWSELAELHFEQSMYSQAIYSLEEVLLIMPNAWNMHARLGEVLFVTGTTSSEVSSVKTLARSVKTFCRSIELCDDYLRGYYGLKLATKQLEQILPKSALSSKDAAREDFQIPTLKTVQELNELATSKLAEIIRRHSLGEQGWNGYQEAEIIAARELLDRDTQGITR